MAALLPFVLSGLFPLSQPRAEVYPLFLTGCRYSIVCLVLCSVGSFREKIQRPGSLQRELSAEGCLGDVCASSANEGHDGTFRLLLRTTEEGNLSRMSVDECFILAAEIPGHFSIQKCKYKIRFKAQCTSQGTSTATHLHKACSSSGTLPRSPDSQNCASDRPENKITF